MEWYSLPRKPFFLAKKRRVPEKRGSSLALISAPTTTKKGQKAENPHFEGAFVVVIRRKDAVFSAT